MLSLQYFHNIFTIILSDKMLLAITNREKNNFSTKFKYKFKIIYYLKFIA